MGRMATSLTKGPKSVAQGFIKEYGLLNQNAFGRIVIKDFS